MKVFKQKINKKKISQHESKYTGDTIRTNSLGLLEIKKNHEMRRFESGAIRDNDLEKIDLEGFLNPLVMQKYGEYMHRHRIQANGDLRDSDNWQNLFGPDHYAVCMKSMWRHFHDLWLEHRGYKSREGIESALMGILFNVQAYALKYFEEKSNNDK